MNSLNITNCHFANIDAFLLNSSLWSICRIVGNTFLTCYWLAKYVYEEGCDPIMMVDSTITDNYINGGTEKSDNNCFEFAYYNGSTIKNNFIDYYRSIYHPKAHSQSSFEGPISIGNQYQMFKYFYYFEEEAFAHSDCTFTSIGDAFNHTDPEAFPPQDDLAEKLSEYTPLSYKRQNQSDTTSYPLPSCIGYTKETGIINITDAKIENNIGCILFVKDSITTYGYSRFKLTITCNNVYNVKNIQTETTNLVYNGGQYKYMNKIETNLVRPITSLPVITDDWVDGICAFGMKVLYDNRILTATMHYNHYQWHCCWVDEYGN